MKLLCSDPTLWDQPFYVDWSYLRDRLAEVSPLPLGQTMSRLHLLFRDYLIPDSVHTVDYDPHGESLKLTRSHDESLPVLTVLCPVQLCSCPPPPPLPSQDHPSSYINCPAPYLHLNGRLETILEEDEEDEEEEEEDDDDDDDVKRPSVDVEEEGVKEDENKSWWRPTSVLKTLVLLALLIMAVFCVSYIYSSTSVTYGNDGVPLSLDIHVFLPHPSGFTFGVDKLMKSRLLTSSFHVLTESFRLPNCSVRMAGCDCYDPPPT